MAGIGQPINAMLGLNFSCDGTHYMSVEEFLEKPESFWFGAYIFYLGSTDNYDVFEVV